MQNETNTAGKLWEASAKLRGLSETLLQANGEMPYSEVGLTGISYIILNIANQVEDVRNTLDREKHTLINEDEALSLE